MIFLWFSPLFKEYNTVYLLLLICVVKGWGAIGKNLDTEPADQSRKSPDCSSHKTFSCFLSNISALLQLGFVGFLTGPFRKLGATVKNRKNTQKFFEKRSESYRSCRAIHHNQPVTELRISHKFSSVLSGISQPIKVII